MQYEKSLRVTITFVFLSLFVSLQAFAQRNSGEVLAPKDMVFALELLSPIDTKTNKKDDKFDCKVLSPVQYAGSIVSGHIRKVKNSGKANGKSEIDLAFDTITLTDGRVGGFNAQVQ